MKPETIARIRRFSQERYQNEQFQTRLKTYAGFTAQIIQHELDHLDGVLICENARERRNADEKKKDLYCRAAL